MKIDLHTHSNQSDGTFSPEEIIKLSEREEVKCIALCDHDTTEGVELFKLAASEKAITAIGGIEMSTSCSTGSCHILGLNVDINNSELQYILKATRDARDKRNQEIINKLNEFGIDIKLELIQNSCSGKVIGRPHIANELVKMGIVQSMKGAFELFLKKGAKAYVPRYQIDPVSAICALKKASAVTVLAHPVQLNIADDQIKIFIKQLKEYGLDAIEIYTPHHSPARIHAYLNIASELELGISGGSDFHGQYKPDRQLGMYSPGKQIPSTVISIFGDAANEMLQT